MKPPVEIGLFPGFECETIEPVEFCLTCAHRERWQCNSKIIQYCGIRRDNRTFNRLLKIKVTNPACEHYERA